MVQSTHTLVFTGDEVAKRYRSWDRGEPEREWDALVLLHRFARGLAPAPLERRADDGTPVVVMARVPGEPLGASPLTPAQVAGLGAAIRRLHTAVPSEDLADVPTRRSGASELGAQARSWIQTPHERVSPSVESALGKATSWLHGSELTSLMAPPPDRVFTQGDGNIGNYLWDGDCCRVVDFEDSGGSEPAYDVADLIEHVTVWMPGLVTADDLVEHLRLRPDQVRRLQGFRRLMATYWLLMLLPGNPGHGRNPAGSVERQAQRLHDFLA